MEDPVTRRTMMQGTGFRILCICLNPDPRHKCVCRKVIKEKKIMTEDHRKVKQFLIEIRHKIHDRGVWIQDPDVFS